MILVSWFFKTESDKIKSNKSLTQATSANMAGGLLSSLLSVLDPVVLSAALCSTCIMR